MTRILFYCHNTYGLGHVVRSLRIAEAAVAGESARCAVITGCRYISAVGVPERTDIELLPPARIDASGRPLPMEDDPDQSDLIARRSRQIRAFVEQWRPDALIVDHHPLGLGGELVDALLANEQVRCFLGVPYAEGTAPRPFRNPRLRRTVERYTHVLDYSDDGAAGELAFGGTPVHIDRVGIVTRPPLPPVPSGARPLVAGVAGGGTGGMEVYRVLFDALRDLPEWRVRLLVGPFGDLTAVRALAAEREDVEVWERGTAEEAIRDASVVVARSGYNTSYTLIQSDKPVAFLPQQMAGDDQPSRARRLSALPKVWNLAGQPATSVLNAILRSDLTPVQRDLPFSVNGAAEAARAVVAEVAA